MVAGVGENGTLWVSAISPSSGDFSPGLSLGCYSCVQMFISTSFIQFTHTACFRYTPPMVCSSQDNQLCPELVGLQFGAIFE